jgi:hypothetical protein
MVPTMTQASKLICFDDWLRGLEARHLAKLTFTEVARGLRALSSTYVERRDTLREGAALAGAGKRAAFALFYGPLHYLLVREIVQAIPAAIAPAGAPGRIEKRALGAPEGVLVDLGCGTGASGAAWALLSGPRPPGVLGIDLHPWVLDEAAWTYRIFGLVARTKRTNLAAVSLPRSPVRLLAAFVLNELAPARREALLRGLLDRAAAGDRVLIVEPIARSVARWWGPWRDAYVSAGARADEWRFSIQLPPILAKLDRAAGLDHRELTARSLWIGGQY